MTAITIHLPDEHVKELNQRAAELNISTEQLIQASIEDMLAQPDEEFRQALEYVLKKNAELYRRLA